MTTYTSTWVSRDGSSNGTKPKGARLALGGLVASHGPSILDVRLGVLADVNPTPVVAGTAGMTYDVRAAVFVTNPTGSSANGPVIGANDATVNVATTAAPGSNSRYDVIWVRQHVVVADGGTDTDVILEIGVTQGTVAASPAVPAVPTGALALRNFLVTAGATATNTLVSTRMHNFTTTRGGVIPVFASTEKPTTAHVGQTIWYDVDKTIQVWDGTAWQVVPPPSYQHSGSLSAQTLTGALVQNGTTLTITVPSTAAVYRISAVVDILAGAGAGVSQGQMMVDAAGVGPSPYVNHDSANTARVQFTVVHRVTGLSAGNHTIGVGLIDAVGVAGSVVTTGSWIEVQRVA